MPFCRIFWLLWTVTRLARFGQKCNVADEQRQKRVAMLVEESLLDIVANGIQSS